MIVVSGSSNQLYYDVACQAAEPAKKEGRIWVKSSVAMTSFEFVNPWIGAGNGSVAIFGDIGGANPASSNNVIEVFNTKRSGINHREKLSPKGCNQVQGAVSNWVPVDAYVCHSDTWVQFSWSRVSLYNNGVWNTSLTGEWIAQGKLISSESNPAKTPYVTKNADNFKVYYNSSDNGSGIYYASKKINLTNFKTLHFEGNMSYYSDSYATVGLNVWTNIGNTVVQNRSAALLGNAFASGVRALDVSALTGDYYIGFNVYANRGAGTSSVICKNLYLS